MERNTVIVAPQSEARASTLATNKVLKNTYLLLSATLAFSALVAFVAASVGMPYLGPWITLGGYFALLFAVTKTANSGWGLVWVFALTGFMGLTIGPVVSAYAQAFPDGHSLVMTAFGITAVAVLEFGADIWHFGSDVHSIKDFYSQTRDRIIPFGGVNPHGVMRYGSPQQVWEETRAVVEAARGHKLFLSTGTGTTPEVTLENLRAMVEASLVE